MLQTILFTTLCNPDDIAPVLEQVYSQSKTQAHTFANTAIKRNEYLSV